MNNLGPAHAAGLARRVLWETAMSPPRLLLFSLLALAVPCFASVAAAEPDTHANVRLGGAVGTTVLAGNHVVPVPLAVSVRAFAGVAWLEPELSVDVNWAGIHDEYVNGAERETQASFVMYGLGLRVVPWWRSYATPYVTLQLHDVVPPTTDAFLAFGPRLGFRLHGDRFGFYFEGGVSTAVAGKDHWFDSELEKGDLFPQISGGLDFTFGLDDER